MASEAETSSVSCDTQAVDRTFENEARLNSQPAHPYPPVEDQWTDYEGAPFT
jgi:hypothetical protein